MTFPGGFHGQFRLLTQLALDEGGQTPKFAP
jgi:hypothetical protein